MNDNQQHNAPNLPDKGTDKHPRRERESSDVIVKNWMIGPDSDGNIDDITLLHQDMEEVLIKVGQRSYLVLVCYDITEPRRLARVAKVCLAYGERVQKSVFECHLSQRQLNELIGKLVPLIDQRVDYLRVYKIAGIPQVQVWGKIPLTEDEDLIII